MVVVVVGVRSKEELRYTESGSCDHDGRRDQKAMTMTCVAMADM